MTPQHTHVTTHVGVTYIEACERHSVHEREAVVLRRVRRHGDDDVLDGAAGSQLRERLGVVEDHGRHLLRRELRRCLGRRRVCLALAA